MARDSRAPLSSKEGFSVVAPTSVMVPSSMCGRKLSCCARLKRWISSMNSSVPLPVSRRLLARSKALRRSCTPEKMAESCSNTRLVSSASRRATVVLPVAGRPPQDHALQPAAPEHARQRALGADEMILPDDLGELARPQPVGQRPRRLLLHAGGLEQICHAPIIARLAMRCEAELREPSPTPAAAGAGRRA